MRAFRCWCARSDAWPCGDERGFTYPPSCANAGTPGIADPGAGLVRFIRDELPDVRIVPIPGPSAVTAILSVAGVDADRFTFLGYPPHQKGRRSFFTLLSSIEVRPIVLYESPHRIDRTLADLAATLGEEHPATIGRELTKLHEEIFRGSLAEARRAFAHDRRRGEFALVIP